MWRFSLIFLLFATEAFAGEVFKLSEVTANYGVYRAGSRDPLFWGDLRPKDTLNATIKSTIFNYLDWTSTVKSQTSQYQFHTVGLEMSFGFHITSQIEVYAAHWSQHVLDNQYPHAGYPWSDHFGVKFKTYFDPSAAPKSFW